MLDFTNYLKISLRNLYREKLYALINLAGLSLGIACCLILGLYLKNELTYDKHFVQHKQIYRVANEFYNNGQLDSFAISSISFGPLMAEQYDQEILDYVRILKNPSLLISHEDDAYFWERTIFADSNIFDIFNHDIIYGDPESALEDMSSIAVSETFARRYFGNLNPIGETITSERGTPITITLVFADPPENSHLKYDAIFPMASRLRNLPENDTIKRQMLWSLGVFTYFLMPEGYNPDDFVALTEDFYDRNMRALGDSRNFNMRFWLEPLADIHLNSDLMMDEPTGNKAYLYVFAAVAAFIIAVACINYMNLSTARSMKRAKEVGMRKILGANRSALIAQYLAEAMLFSLLSTVLAVILVEIVLDLSSVSQLLGTELDFSLLQEPQLLLWFLIFSVVVGFLAGAYPAVYLSSWAPLSALVSTTGAAMGNIRLRQVLVLAQFIISISVVACTLLMSAQMKFLSEKSLGFDKENKVIVRLIGVDLLKKIPVIKQELSKHPGILGITTHSQIMGQDMGINNMTVESEMGTMDDTTVIHTQVDMDYLKVMGMNLVEGRDFSQRLLTDVGTSYIVNKAMVENMGWNQALGKRVLDGRVIGVVEDFNFQSLRNSIEPLLLRPMEDDLSLVTPEAGIYMSRYMTINIAGEGMRDTLAFLEDQFAEFDPKHPFEFQFLDDALNELYESEQRLMSLVAIFAGVCIFIACLGLFGLASFTTEQRNKEIGIRKVLGASTAQIIFLLSRSVLLLVLVGGIIASLLSYLVINEWLTTFAYRTEINLGIFIVSAALALMVAYLTVAMQSFRTARADPVDALRYE